MYSCIISLIQDIVTNSISRSVTGEITCNWRASEASETLSGVTQLKIGNICLWDVRMSFVL